MKNFGSIFGKRERDPRTGERDTWRIDRRTLGRCVAGVVLFAVAVTVGIAALNGGRALLRQSTDDRAATEESLLAALDADEGDGSFFLALLGGEIPLSLGASANDSNAESKDAATASDSVDTPGDSLALADNTSFYGFTSGGGNGLTTRGGGSSGSTGGAPTDEEPSTLDADRTLPGLLAELSDSDRPDGRTVAIARMDPATREFRPSDSGAGPAGGQPTSPNNAIGPGLPQIAPGAPRQGGGSPDPTGAGPSAGVPVTSVPASPIPTDSRPMAPAVSPGNPVDPSGADPVTASPTPSTASSLPQDGPGTTDSGRPGGGPASGPNGPPPVIAANTPPPLGVPLPPAIDSNPNGHFDPGVNGHPEALPDLLHPPLLADAAGSAGGGDGADFFPARFDVGGIDPSDRLAEVDAVPEPTTLLLVAVGLIGLGALRRRAGSLR